MAARLIKVGPCLGVRKTKTEAEQNGADWTKPGAYGNPTDEHDGFVVEPFTRFDGITVFCIFAGELQNV